MDYVTYILYSFSANRFYTGYSANLIQRIYWHNNGNKGFTTRFRPWVIIHVEFFETKKLAMERELFFKTGKGREFINQHFIKSAGFISA